MERARPTFLMYILLILLHVHLTFCAEKCEPEELTVRLSTGDSLELRAYTSHLKFLTNLHKTIDQKVQAGSERLLRYAKLNQDQANDFLLNIDSNQYLFLQLVQSLASKDVTFPNLLLQEFQKNSIEINPISNEWLKSNIKLPTESMYNVVQSIVYADSMGILEIPKEVIGEILLMANKSELLHRSCKEGDLKVSEWLLGLSKEYDLVPLLENAMNNGRLELARLLLRNGALKNATDMVRITKLVNTTLLLHVAAASNVPEAVSVLVDAGAPINAVDEAGRSPLHIALQHNDTASVQKLLSKGADAKLISNSGDSALHIASSKGNVDAVKLLLRYYDRFDEKNNLGLTPLNIAEQSSIFYIIEYLLQQNITIPSPISTYSNVLPYIYILNDPAMWTNKSDQKKIENYCEETKLFNIRSLHVPYEKELKTKLLELVIKNAVPFLIECLINLGADLRYTTSNNETLLFNAVRSGSIDIVSILIKEGIDVRAKGVNGTTALHVAAGNGFLDIVSLLLKRGADIDAKTNDRLTPLHKAAANGHLEVVKSLYVRTIIQVMNPITNSPLKLAAFNGHIEIVQYFLKFSRFYQSEISYLLHQNSLHLAAKAGHTDIVNILLDIGYDVNVPDAEGKTPLFWAAYGGSVLTVSTLLDKGADIQTRSQTIDHLTRNNKSRIRETPLHMAALNGHLEVCKILLDKGVDKDAKNSLGESPLYYAAMGGHYNVVKYLVEKKAFKSGKNNHGSTALHAAAEGGHNDVIDFLYGKGMHIEIENNNGQTPLHYACQFGHLSTVKYLIEKSANVNASSKYGTPLSFPAREGHEDIAVSLLENGANIEATDNQGNTPLMHAVMREHYSMVGFLLRRGASLNPESKREDGKTPLHLAMDLTYDGGMAFFLLLKGASLSNTAKDGTTAFFEAVDNRQENVIMQIIHWERFSTNVNNTRMRDQVSCLHMAVIRGSWNISEALLDKGAYVNALDAEKNTPLHYAVSRKEIEIARLLLERGADVHIKNKKEETPYHIAKTLDSPKIAKTLRLCDCE